MHDQVWGLCLDKMQSEAICRGMHTCNWLLVMIWFAANFESRKELVMDCSFPSHNVRGSLQFSSAMLDIVYIFQFVQ